MITDEESQTLISWVWVFPVCVSHPEIWWVEGRDRRVEERFDNKQLFLFL